MFEKCVVIPISKKSQDRQDRSVFQEGDPNIIEMRSKAEHNKFLSSFFELSVSSHNLSLPPLTRTLSLRK